MIEILEISHKLAILAATAITWNYSHWSVTLCLALMYARMLLGDVTSTKVDRVIFDTIKTVQDSNHKMWRIHLDAIKAEDESVV